ncbi:MAG: ferredoxin--NADP reductase [Microthrixaceae bacterium]
MSSNGYDLVIYGGNAGGLSLAISSQRSGLKRVRILESGSAVAFPDLVGEHHLDVGYGETVRSVERVPAAPADADSASQEDPPSDLLVTTDKHTYRARAVVIAERSPSPDWAPPMGATLGERILVDTTPENPIDEDVLVVGSTDHAVEIAAKLAAEGAGVVLAAGGMDPTLLSPAGDNWLRRLERERRATLLYRSLPDQVAEVDGYPMAFFSDRRTPDLQFDHVVFASERTALKPGDVGLSDEALKSGRVWFIGSDSEPDSTVPTAPGWRIGFDVASAFPGVEPEELPSAAKRRRRFTGALDELRAEHYNATITYFEPTHSDLWVLRVKPDHGEINHLPGQYASLGLGYWEDRIDDAEDAKIDENWEKLVRRSYSISSRMFDDYGYLSGEEGAEELEFYIVLVPPTPDNVPGLTPRLALKRPGDRIYLGPKVAGRYTLGPVTNPKDTVVFFSTGTGEAPHNAMVVELLRKGHTGPILSAVSVREWADLGYIDKHRDLEQRYANYRYHPMPTREPEVPKRYIQSLISDDVLTKQFGLELDPEHTHVFLCGNPSMIGLPEEKDGVSEFPETTGVVELLTKRGFTLDHRKQRGNIHFEEYW